MKDIRDVKGLGLAARIIIFTVATLWSMVFLLFCTVMFPGLIDYLKDPDEWGISGALLYLIMAWYIVTFVLVAIGITVWSLNQVAHWEDKEDN
jgi:hypothetical protein